MGGCGGAVEVVVLHSLPEPGTVFFPPTSSGRVFLMHPSLHSAAMGFSFLTHLCYLFFSFPFKYIASYIKNIPCVLVVLYIRCFYDFYDSHLSTSLLRAPDGHQDLMMRHKLIQFNTTMILLKHYIPSTHKTL